MDQPNIVVFMTDHQRGDTLSADSPVLTPCVDRFRADAVEFTNAHCPAPHCCPSRASFFTGKYPSEHGVWNNVDVSNTLSRGLFDNTRCFSDDLHDAGYHLYFSGKWHVSREEGPQDHGFECIHHAVDYHRFAHTQCTDEWKFYADHSQIDRGDEERSAGQIIRPGYTRYQQYGLSDNPFGDRDVVDSAVKKLHELKDSREPFFLYAGVLGPHDPYNLPQEYLDLYKDIPLSLPDSFDDDLEDKPVLYRRTKANYSQLTRQEHLDSLRHFYAFCTYEDAQFGRLIDALKENGQYENTIVLYLSDHGDYIGAHGLWAKGLPCFREAYHVCSMVGGGYFKKAGYRQGECCDAMVNLTDYAPTFLELCGVQARQSYTGASLVPFFRGEEPKHWRTELYTQSNGNEVYGIQRCVYDRKWKYVFNSFDYDELYDLENDPNEMHNLIYTARPQDTPYRDVVRAMCRKMWQFAYDTGDNCVNPYIMTALAPYGPGIIFKD